MHPEPFFNTEQGFFIMQENITFRNKERVVEVRSDAGKLLYIKTKEGYELKCPRSKEISMMDYQAMLADCLLHLGHAAVKKFLH